MTSGSRSSVIQGYFEASTLRQLNPSNPPYARRPAWGAKRAPTFEELTLQAHGVATRSPIQAAGGAAVIPLSPHSAVFSSHGGQPLPASIQGRMESLFGADFSRVRVHVGPEAASVGALAFTQGSDIYFAPGQYNPSSQAGQRLLGHELTHVVQQRAGRVRNPLGTGIVIVQDPALEAEAERMAAQAAMHQGHTPSVAQPMLAPAKMAMLQPTSAPAVIPARFYIGGTARRMIAVRRRGEVIINAPNGRRSRVQSLLQMKPTSASNGQGAWPRRPRALAHTDAVLQRLVVINEGMLDWNERIESMNYKRGGSEGGHHFVADAIIAKLAWRLIENKTRAGARQALIEFWTAGEFVGALTFPDQLESAAAYDQTVNSVIHWISNQKMNLFNGGETGDEGGTAISFPQRVSERPKTKKFASNLHTAMAATEVNVNVTAPWGMNQSLSDILNWYAMDQLDDALSGINN